MNGEMQIVSAGKKVQDVSGVGLATEAKQDSIITAINNISGEGTYLKKIDSASSTVTYFGRAAIGSSTASAVWQIRKISKSGTVTTDAYADGNDDFDNVWDNRASLSYS